MTLGVGDLPNGAVHEPINSTLVDEVRAAVRQSTPTFLSVPKVNIITDIGTTGIRDMPNSVSVSSGWSRDEKVSSSPVIQDHCYMAQPSTSRDTHRSTKRALEYCTYQQ